LLYVNRKNVKQRIVSLAKPYVRPIVRGKEIKPVEFGAKVHKVLVGGLSFIEHLSYENFNNPEKSLSISMENKKKSTKIKKSISGLTKMD
jgi:transposase, IS5 family